MATNYDPNWWRSYYSDVSQVPENLRDAITNPNTPERNAWEENERRKLANQQAAAVQPGTVYQPTTYEGGVPGFDAYINGNAGARDAWAYLESLLQEYGLGDLNNFAKENIIEGRSANEVTQRLRTTDSYKKRFAVIEQRKAANLPAMSEAEVVAYEKQATQMMRAAGLPSGFWDEPEDFVKLQVNDISIAELQSRVDEGFTAASQAPQDVRDELKNLYGVDEGQIAAFFLDPDRTETLLMRQFNAAQRAATASRAGYGSVGQREAESLVELGVSNEAAQQGFGQLRTQRELFNTLPGQQEGDITREEQFAATFAGNADAQRRIQKRADERIADFSSGGGYTSGQQGQSGGLGVAR